MMHIIYCNRMGYPEDGLKYVCTLDADKPGIAFREMNVVEGYEHPQQLRVRSMCVGDLVVVGSAVHRCMSTGWSTLDYSDPVSQMAYETIPNNTKVRPLLCG